MEKLEQEIIEKAATIKEGDVYKIHCRNFSYGVWDGEGGFIGIREKFGSRYLFTELIPPGPHGTVIHIGEKIGEVPDGIDVKEDGPHKCANCGYDKGIFVRWTKEQIQQIQDAGIHAGLGRPICKCNRASPTIFPNKPLFDYLEEIGQKLKEQNEL